jgi:hypothetical protein
VRSQDAAAACLEAGRGIVIEIVELTYYFLLYLRAPIDLVRVLLSESRVKFMRVIIFLIDDMLLLSAFFMSDHVFFFLTSQVLLFLKDLLLLVKGVKAKRFSL